MYVQLAKRFTCSKLRNICYRCVISRNVCQNLHFFLCDSSYITSSLEGQKKCLMYEQDIYVIFSLNYDILIQYVSGEGGMEEGGGGSW